MKSSIPGLKRSFSIREPIRPVCWLKVIWHIDRKFFANLSIAMSKTMVPAWCAHPACFKPLLYCFRVMGLTSEMLAQEVAVVQEVEPETRNGLSEAIDSHCCASQEVPLAQ